MLRIKSVVTQLVWLTLVSAETTLGWLHGDGDGLYPADSPVLSLSSGGLAYVVGSDSPPALIEFYAEWCGHCQHYAPTYVRVAELMHLQEPSVLVGAVNCPSHTSDCSTHNVRSFPTIKLFGAPSDTKGVGVILGPSDREPDSVVRFVRMSILDLAKAVAAPKIGARTHVRTHKRLYVTPQNHDFGGFSIVNLVPGTEVTTCRGRVKRIAPWCPVKLGNANAAFP